MKRISEYNNITTVSESDVLPIVDVSDTTQATTGSTRKGTIEKIADYLKSRVETLTNKTLTTARLNTPKINEDVTVTATSTELNQLDGVTVGGTASGDIITIDDTQTLTYKTLTSPTITGGTIDGARPMVSVCHLMTGSGQTLTNLANTAITFGTNTELYDPFDWHSESTNTSRITIGTAGLYFIYGSIQANDDATETIRIVGIYKNGTKIMDSRGGVDGSGRWAMPVFTPVSCAINDYIELKCYFQGATDGSVVVANLGVMKI